MVATANNIAQINVSQVSSGVPSDLQQTGVIVTQGGTTSASGTVTLIASQAGLTAILGTGAAATALQAAYTTFQANNGAGRAVYVLELSGGTAAAGITALGVFITANLGKYYAFLLPDGWSADATLAPFLNNYTATTSTIYFYFHATSATYAGYSGIKSLSMVIKALSAPSTEFTAAAWFAGLLQSAPSATNQVTPFAFKYLYGVTPYPISAAEMVAFKAANLNYVDTGAEGGISKTIAKWGVTGDGRDISYWYSVDYVQISLQRAIANEIINGSNNSLAPLYYTQTGINRLKARSQGVMNTAITVGLALSPVTVSAVDFVTYTVTNPSDYALGKYSGLSCTYTPARGFTSITFNLLVTDFVTGA